MRLLKKQPGLPFLLALGVLLILSASFLAVQLWSGDVFRGAAEALEAPMMPPSLPTTKKGESRASLEKKIELAKASAAVDVVAAPEVHESSDAVEDVFVEASEVVEPEVAKPEVVKAKEAPVKAVPAPVTVDLPVKAKEAPPVASKEVPVAKVAVVEVPEVKPVVAAPIEKAVIVPEQKTAPKAYKKPVVAAAKPVAVRRKAKKEVVETELPPEWDWFSTPLKLEVSNGNIEIVSAGKAREIKLVKVTASLPGKSSEPATVEEMVLPVKPVVASEQPFASALARMAKLRHGRKAAAKASPEIAKAVADYRSPSLEKLQQVVAQLRGKYDAREIRSESVSSEKASDAGSLSVVAHDYEEAAPLQALDASSDADAAASAEIDVSEHKFVPYYAGSGTSLSSRINDLLQRGVGYNRR